jgi:non-ribosomal peptide synthase protein (TIGR01720 family)
LRQALPDAVVPQVSFNYLGQFDGVGGVGAGGDALFTSLHADSGQLYDPRAPRPQEFDLNCYVVGGRLCVDWRYGAERHAQATVQRLAHSFIERLDELLDRVAAEASAGTGDLLTPQDFPDAALDDESLAQLLAGME